MREGGQMDIKKMIRDRLNELDREKEKSSKEQEKEIARKEKDIQAKHAQADILEKFIKTVRECFERAKEEIDGSDCPCHIDFFSDEEIGRLCAIQISFWLPNHDKPFYLKYEGKAGSNEIEREICSADPSSLGRLGFPIDYLSREKIEEHIEDFIKMALSK